MSDILLHTDRLLLKGITPAIIHELFNTREKADIMQFFGFDEAGYEHMKTMHERGMETHRLSLFVFLIIHKESGRPIGECGFHTWNATHRRTELFYVLRNDADKQQGYMREALHAALKYGFNELGLHRIQALVANWNTPSVKLLQRYGFTFEGTLREDYCVNGTNEDSDCYSLLRHEWESSKWS